MTCQRTQGFLAQTKAAITTTVNAKKDTIPGTKALAVLEGIDQLYVMKGKKLIHLDLKATKPGREELESLLIGPSGNLRAPTARKGRTLLVGFSEEMYAKVLK